MVIRRGHSLVELLVALVVVAVALAAIGSGTLLAHRTTIDATRHGQAVSVAAVILDSILAGPPPRAGERAHGDVRSVWATRPEAGGTRVLLQWSLRGAAGEGSSLEGFWIPVPPRLEDADTTPGAAAP